MPNTCNVCGKNISDETVPEQFSGYDGSDGWLCDSCWETEARFYLSLGITLPDWCLVKLKEREAQRA